MRDRGNKRKSATTLRRLGYAVRGKSYAKDSLSKEEFPVLSSKPIRRVEYQVGHNWLEPHKGIFVTHELKL